MGNRSTSHLIGWLGIVLAGAGCGRDLFLASGNLEIGPSPASPGDIVVATFNLTLVPTQSHRIIVYIDDTEHLRLTSNDAPGNPVELEVGDAGDLIASYGTGTHSAYVEVQLTDGDEATRTQTADFELQDAVP